MIKRFTIYMWHHLRYGPLFAALTISRWRSFDKRSRSLGNVFALVIRFFPIATRRFDRELRRIFPDMPRSDRMKIGRSMGRKMGQTLFEIYHCAEFLAQNNSFRISGPGLKTLKNARAKGKGALIVSGHFGQWEAIRGVLIAEGLETGAVYRPQSNRHYQRRLSSGIQGGGQPIVQTGSNGTREMIRHLKKGGFIAILLDEKSDDGAKLPFLGQPALTSLAAARLALKYDLVMVPAFGLRVGDGQEFEVQFESEIPHSDVLKMTQKFNDLLSARILEHPEQWYWLLQRWHGV
jgi:KDO2-lipid IV(A) lauroyltransferase